MLFRAFSLPSQDRNDRPRRLPRRSSRERSPGQWPMGWTEANPSFHLKDGFGGPLIWQHVNNLPGSANEGRGRMDYLFFCRDKPDTGGLLESLVEKHWSFMDGYADRLKARGPTLSVDGGEHTGSLHIVDLATPEEVEVFAYREPFYAGGAYTEVMIRRWENLLDRSMVGLSDR